MYKHSIKIEYHSVLKKEGSDICYNIDEPWKH